MSCVYVNIFVCISWSSSRHWRSLSSACCGSSTASFINGVKPLDLHKPDSGLALTSLSQPEVTLVLTLTSSHHCLGEWNKNHLHAGQKGKPIALSCLHGLWYICFFILLSVDFCSTKKCIGKQLYGMNAGMRTLLPFSRSVPPSSGFHLY